MMMKGRRLIDKVRASRDGHEYQEAWIARKTMERLWPSTDFVSITLEGPAVIDQTHVSVQIA